jgi:Tfp pilus assembly PilM family ATPase
LARAVGLDVGARHVRLVELEGGSRGLRVCRLGEREIALPEGGDREEAVREATDALFRETRAGRDETVLSWPAESCILRELSVPFREREQIRKVVKFEFESHLHNDAIEDVVLDFVATGETRDGARLLCVAAPKPPLRARLEALRKARVEPVAVDADVASLAAAASAAGLLEGNPTCVLVDVGARTTKLVLVVDGAVRSARAFLGGTDTAGPAPGGASGAAPAEGAVAAAVEGGAPEAGGTALAVAEDRRADLVGRVAREVTRTLANAAAGAAVAKVHVTGRGALLPGFRDGLAARLGFEVLPFDLFGRLQHPVPAERLEEAAATYAVAVGAAARGLGVSPLALDLRREDLAYSRRFDQVKGALAVGLGVLLLGVGFLLWRARGERDVAHAEFNSMVATLRKTSDAVETDYKKALGEDQAKKLYAGSGDPLAAVPDARRRVKQMNDHLRNEMGISTEVPPIASSLLACRKANEAIKSVREKLEYCLLTSEIYGQKECTINVVLSAAEHVDILKKAFEDVKGANGPLFKHVEYGTVQQNKTSGKYAVQFTLRFEKK